MQDSWLFDQPRNCAAVCLRSIAEGRAPVLLVAHNDDDHSWQFLDGEPVRMDSVVLVSMASVIDADPTLHQLADLPAGWEASRTSVGAPWQRSRSPVGPEA